MDFLPWLQILFIVVAIVFDTDTLEFLQRIQILLIVVVIYGGKWFNDKFIMIATEVE